MKPDRQQAALDRLRQKGLGLAPVMVDGKPKRPRTAQRGAGRAVTVSQVPSDTSTRPEKIPPLASAFPVGLLTPSTFRLWIPAPDDFLNLNDRPHHFRKARLVKAWRQAGARAAAEQGLPTGWGRVAIVCEVVKANARSYDAHNLMLTAKSLVDGVVLDHGLCVDDSNECVVGPDIRPGGIAAQAGVFMLVTRLKLAA